MEDNASEDASSSVNSREKQRKVHISESPIPAKSASRKSSIVLRNELLLHEACIKDNYIATKRLLEMKVDVNSRSHMNRTPLHWAITYGFTDIIDLLIKSKCDLEVTDKFGMRAILMAASLGHKDALQRLIKAGANVHATNKLGRCLLHCAVENNQLDLLNFIFESLENFNLNSTDKNNQTALHIAVDLGLNEAANRLIRAGCDVAAKDKHNQTPLHLAVTNNNKEMIEELLKSGVGIDEPDLEGQTVLHIAAEKGNKDVVNLLLNHRANPNSKTNKDWSPLHCAVHFGHTEIADRLLDCGADKHLKNKDGNTPLHLAIISNREAAAKMLISKEVDINSANIHGKIPLAIAARGSYICIVDTIIKVDRARNNNTRTEPISTVVDIQKLNAMKSDFKYGNIQQIFWQLATKQFKPSDWKKLAIHWKFTPEQIKAIEHQYTGTTSYKEHGYRVLHVWLSGMDQDKNVIKELYEALVIIGRKDAAEVMRKKAEKQSITETPPPHICQQCCIL